jgi:hypothetical protein
MDAQSLRRYELLHLLVVQMAAVRSMCLQDSWRGRSVRPALLSTTMAAAAGVARTSRTRSLPAMMMLALSISIALTAAAATAVITRTRACASTMMAAVAMLVRR